MTYLNDKKIVLDKKKNYSTMFSNTKCTYDITLACKP